MHSPSCPSPSCRWSTSPSFRSSATFTPSLSSSVLPTNCVFFLFHSHPAFTVTSPLWMRYSLPIRSNRLLSPCFTILLIRVMLTIPLTDLTYSKNRYD